MITRSFYRTEIIWCIWKDKKQRIGATGLEPVTGNSQTSNDKEFTEKAKTDTVQKLPKTCNSDTKSIAEKDKDLQQIVTVWPQLPEHIKAAIKALIQTHKK